MRHALIIAGGAGTRLWPRSTKAQPKQLIPFIDGRSLLQIAVERLQGLIPPEQIHICAGRQHREQMLEHLGISDRQFIAEPVGRDTLNAIGLGTGVLTASDPEAVVAIFTADHLIEPEDQFRDIVERGYALAESDASTLVTFGIAPTHPATGFGYLELGPPLDAPEPSAPPTSPAYRLASFKEKPDPPTAQQYLDAGPTAYLWNSGMFVGQGKMLMDCIERYMPENAAGLQRCIDAWDSPERDRVLDEQYPQLEKISIDYAVMEPAARDPRLTVASIPMPLRWLDVGSWPSYAQTLDADEQGNAVAAEKALMRDSSHNLLVASDPDHLIATIGVDNLIIVQTPRATLVCHKNQAERIKQMHADVEKTLGDEWV